MHFLEMGKPKSRGVRDIKFTFWSFTTPTTLMLHVDSEEKLSSVISDVLAKIQGSLQLNSEISNVFSGRSMGNLQVAHSTLTKSQV